VFSKCHHAECRGPIYLNFFSKKSLQILKCFSYQAFPSVSPISAHIMLHENEGENFIQPFLVKFDEHE